MCLPIRLFLFAMPLIGVQMTVSNYYQAVGKSKKAMVIISTIAIVLELRSLGIESK